MTPTRPLLRYYGGKWRIAPLIVSYMPKHDIYVEPFGGGASVLLSKQRSSCEVYNDSFGEVVNVFRQMRDSGEQLIRGIFLTPYSRDEYVAAYEPTTDPLEAARRFVYRSTAGIGSNSSVKKNGFRTSLCDVKHATAKSWANLPETLEAVVLRLRGVIIENREAVRVMEQYDAVNTLHYLDPPYLGATRKDRTKCYAHEMRGEEAHSELLAFARTLKGKVMISGYEHASYDEQLEGWHKVRLKGGRDQINQRTKEVLWMNYLPEETLL